MEQGQMRCDVNLSLRPHGREKFGTRSETKNVNSLRSVERAARYEIQRHAAVLNSGGTIIQETRHFHEDTGSTTSGRVKEEAEDYRYFPEPDLVPVAPSRAWVEEIRSGLPEQPLARRNRLSEEWGITAFDMQSILNAGAIDPIVATIDAGADAASARKWWMGELARSANESGKALDELPITPEQVARVTALVTAGDLNDKLARQVIEGVLAGEGTPDEVVEKRGLKVVSDDGALTTAVQEAIAGNPGVADKIRGGKVAAVGALVGAVMKATRGQADAARVKELILEQRASAKAEPVHRARPRRPALRGRSRYVRRPTTRVKPRSRPRSAFTRSTESRAMSAIHAYGLSSAHTSLHSSQSFQPSGCQSAVSTSTPPPRVQWRRHQAGEWNAQKPGSQKGLRCSGVRRPSVPPGGRA